MKTLISHGIDLNNRNILGETRLHRAFLLNEIEVIKYFLDHGAQKEIKNNASNTPYQVALSLKNQQNIPISDVIINVLKP